MVGILEIAYIGFSVILCFTWSLDVLCYSPSWTKSIQLTMITISLNTKA